MALRCVETVEHLMEEEERAGHHHSLITLTKTHSGEIAKLQTVGERCERHHFRLSAIWWIRTQKPRQACMANLTLTLPPPPSLSPLPDSLSSLDHDLTIQDANGNIKSGVGIRLQQESRYGIYVAELTPKGPGKQCPCDTSGAPVRARLLTIDLGLQLTCPGRSTRVTC